MTRSRRWSGCLLLALALLPVWLAPSEAAQQRLQLRAIDTSLDQCANRLGGTAAPINDCTQSAWTSGNVNRNSSLYREGDFVPMRSVVRDLVAGRTYTYRIGYDAVEGGLHAYDYLGSYNASAFSGQQIVPCTAISGTAPPHACGSTPSTVAVPVDTATTFPSGAAQKPGEFSLWGGTLHPGGVSYVNPAPISVNTPGKVPREVDITFTAHGDTIVLAWGAHIASTLDWGAGRTFISAGSGSSFHMRLLQIQPQGELPISTGNKEIGLSATALAPVPSPFTTQVAPSQPVTVGQTVIDTATLGGSGSAPVTGEVQFFVCGPSSTPPDCRQGGVLVQPGVVVLRAGLTRASLVNGTASAAFTPTEPGQYCFRVEFTPSDTALYSPASHTNTTTECFVATLPPPRLTITKLCDPANDPGEFNLLVDGAPHGGAAGTNVPCGGTTGAIQVNPGTYTVSESAGTDTSLGDYTATIGGDCAPNGTITLALGDSATCTITNVRHPPPPPATLTVHKVCDPTSDLGQFAIHVNGPNVNGLPIASLACGDTTQPVQLAPGSYTVSEAGVPPTDLADYDSVISGDCAADGSITLASGQAATCTITNTRIPRLTVTKLCVPANDPGEFNLLVDGAPLGGAAGTNVPCGGTTGAVQVAAGTHTVSESAGTGTNLGDYTSTIGGDCAANGSITLAAGDSATCTITNVHTAAPPPATLTVNKVCDPTSDQGQFEIQVDGSAIATLACGDTTGSVQLAPGSYTVSEAGVPPTDLADYDSVISGDCAADGSITLASGQAATCTITNTRIPPPPPRLTVTKLCVPANDPGRFNLLVDGAPLGGAAGTDVPCGGTTGAVQVAAGTLTVSESAGTDTSLGDYTSTIGGDCAADGSITLAAGDSATCTITNVRKPAPPPASLTVHKVCNPANDPGEFEIHVTGPHVNRRNIATLACGDTTSPIELAPGSYTVSEAGIPPTSLADYTTVISGDCGTDGSITLAAGETASCTFTNTRRPAPTTTLRVDKACDPTGDSGRFNLTIDTTDGNRVHQVVVGCGGTTGAVPVGPGGYTVGETGAGATHLGDYDVIIGGDCAADGTIALQAGDQKTCLITNIRKGAPPPALLTVTKICIPADDGGRFNLTIVGQGSREVACGGTLGPVAVPPGQHQVSESAGSGTSLSDYTTSIGGSCAPDGTVTVAAGVSVTCTITNMRRSTPPATGTVAIEKHCSPAGTTGHFEISLDGALIPIDCGATTGPIETGVGDHQIGEVGETQLMEGRFQTTVSGDCSADGSFSVGAGQHVTCIVTNTLEAPITPPTPPKACYKLTVRPRTVRVGKPTRVLARVHRGRRPVPGVRVFARGPGVSTFRTTGANGRAVFRLTFRRRGILRVTIRKAYLCPKPPPNHVGVIGAATPPVTG